MEQNKQQKLFVTKLFIEHYKEDEEIVGLFRTESPFYQQLKPLIRNLIKVSDTTFQFDFKTTFPTINFKHYNKEPLVEEHRYVRQGGGDLYSFVKLSIRAIEAPVIIVKEALESEFLEFIGGNKSNNECWEWMESYPYVLKAILDYYWQQKTVGLEITLLGIRFHPIDYKPYGYYICTKRLLEKLEKHQIL